LIDRRRHSNALEVRHFTQADRDIDHNLVVAKVRERLAFSKTAARRWIWRHLIPTSQMRGGVKEQCQLTSRNEFAALENLEDNGNINRA
jgi:hypothetical protein